MIDNDHGLIGLWVHDDTYILYLYIGYIYSGVVVQWCLEWTTYYWTDD